MAWTEIPFGDGLKGDLFYPQVMHPGSFRRHLAASVQLPVRLVDRIPWSSKGSDYRLDQRPSFASLVRRGFVYSRDQIGFGSRVLDAREFYTRYPASH